MEWPFQDPKLEVPTIYKAYFSGLCKGISPENMALYGTVMYSTSILGSWRSPIEKWNEVQVHVPSTKLFQMTHDYYRLFQNGTFNHYSLVNIYKKR